MYTLAKWRQVLLYMWVRRQTERTTVSNLAHNRNTQHWVSVYCVGSAALSWVACRSLQQNPERWKETSELWRDRSSSLTESLVSICLSVCLSISTSPSTPLHSTLPQTELMTSRPQQSMSTHIQQLPESTQTSPAVFVSHLSGHCTPFSLYCLLSVVWFYGIFYSFLQLCREWEM